MINFLKEESMCNSVLCNPIIASPQRQYCRLQLLYKFLNSKKRFLFFEGRRGKCVQQIRQRREAKAVFFTHLKIQDCAPLPL